MDEICYCGHVYDEHDDQPTVCLIEGCPCEMFDPDPAAEEED